MVISWNPLGSVDEKHRYLVGIQFGTQLCDSKECEPDVPDSNFLTLFSTPRSWSSVPEFTKYFTPTNAPIVYYILV